MNKTLLLSFAALTLGLGAEEIAATQSSNDMNNGCAPKPCPVTPQCTVMPPCSAAPMSNNGWYVFADALYWHADEGGTDYACKNDDTTAPINTGPNHTLNFKWSWGFRVGLGATIDYDQWDTNVYYTWFHTENSNAVGTKGSESAIDLLGVVGLITQGKVDWRIHYSMIDWELGRWFYAGKHFSLRPHVGVKGGWIDQKIDRDFTTAVTTWDIDIKNNFWGVGVSGGLNTLWTFVHVNKHHFSLFGDLAGALMYGHFDVDHKEHTTAGTGFHPRDLDKNLAVSMLQAMLGLSWDVPFNCNRNHFGVRVGYEFQFWFRQNQTIINEFPIGPNIGYQRAHDDLALQGLTIDFRFDF